MSERFKPLQQRETEPTGPGRKPVDFVFVSHNANVEGDLAQLSQWSNRIREMLQSKSTGKVVVFMEDEGASPEYSQGVREYTAMGLNPAEAKLNAQMDLIPDEQLDDPEVQGLIEESERDLTTGFEGTANALLANIMQEFPGRVDLIPEAQPEHIRNEPIDIATMYNSILTADLPEQTKVELFRIQNKKFAELQKEREGNIYNTISFALLDDDVIGSVGFLGAVHTGVSQDFATTKDENGNKKFTSARAFPEQQGSKYNFSPFMSLLRKQMRDLDVELTDDEIGSAFIIERDIREKQEVSDALGFDETRQAQLADAYATFQAMGDFGDFTIGDAVDQASTGHPQLDATTDRPLEEANGDVDWTGNNDPDEGPNRTL